MKKLLSLVVVGAMFTFVACGPSAKEKEATQEADQEKVENMMGDIETDMEADNAEEQVAEGTDHVCNDECKEGACNLVCGEKGHECSEACHAHEHGEEGHDHADHDHDEVEEVSGDEG